MSAIKEDPSGWQLKCNTLLERNGQMLRNSLLSDISFVIVEENDGQDANAGRTRSEEIPAHKYVLAISSPVFFAMFYGEIAEKTNVIDIPDADKDSFVQFLSYLYTDKCELNMESVSTVFYLAKKYLVPSLINHCINYLIKNLTAQNVFSILCLAMQFEETQLVNKCWNIVEIQCTEALTSDGFLRISLTILKDLLSRDTLDVQEITLFKACSRWAEYQCVQLGVPVNSEEKRKVLGDALDLIRYLAIGEDRFARDVVQTNLLPHETTVHVFLMFKNLMKEQRFSKKPRKKRWEILTCNRYSDSKAKYYLPLVKDRDNSGLPDRIAFTVNKRIMIHGVRLFGEHTGEKYKVKLDISDNNNEIVGSKEGDFYSKVMNYQEKGLYVFDVFFSDPVEVKMEQGILWQHCFKAHEHVMLSMLLHQWMLTVSSLLFLMWTTLIVKPV
ncbi:BTB/POZ domain-containing protein 6-like [Xenia sp. Carnegie-2017]|uniref:BTB/POZ domain-containing protein 6-like n=1 Tax=Xenia sp. Carnegie-2017 TaxID=2897299 RepID=UPI001F04390C|nr:BTB/POZ domain-containing protein 6-like [Xenia sp. Carnegie-2017]